MLKDGKRRNNLIQFQRRGSFGKTPSGNVHSGDWAPYAERHAAFAPRFAREIVLGERLVSSMQGVLTVLRCKMIAEVTPAYRVYFLAGPYKGRTCQIRSIVPTSDNREIEFLLEDGVDT